MILIHNQITGSITYKTLTLTLKRDRPRTTWMRTIISELEEIGFSMGKGQYITKDRGRWWQIVDAFCPIGDEKDR